jgi:hypothetical protein
MSKNRQPVRLRRGNRDDESGPEVPAEMKRYLDQRIAAALEWYVRCDVCAETLANVRRDLDSVLSEMRTKFRLERLPFLLRVRFEGSELVVSAITREVS